MWPASQRRSPAPLKEVDDPQRFGVAEVVGKKVVGIEEKPKSRHVVTGVYMYDADVFSIIKTLKPSKRKELEITDVNNAYIRKGTMTCEILDGWWPKRRGCTEPQAIGIPSPPPYPPPSRLMERHFDDKHSRGNDIRESRGLQGYHQEDKDWFCRAGEKRWITMNDNSGWEKTSRKDGRIQTSVRCIA